MNPAEYMFYFTINLKVVVCVELAVDPVTVTVDVPGGVPGVPS